MLSAFNPTNDAIRLTGTNGRRYEMEFQSPARCTLVTLGIYNVTTAAFTPLAKTYIIFNSNSRIDSAVDVTTSLPTSMVVYQYDANQRLINRTQKTWTISGWQPKTKTNYLFNSAGQLVYVGEDNWVTNTSNWRQKIC